MQGWRKGFLARIPPAWSDLTKQILYNAEFRDFIVAANARRTNLILLHKLVGVFPADAQHLLKSLDTSGYVLNMVRYASTLRFGLSWIKVQDEISLIGTNLSSNLFIM